MAGLGGTENVRYALSAGYLDQKGITMNTGLMRYSFRANRDAKVSKCISLGASLLPSFTLRDNLPFSGHYGYFGIIQTAMGISPHVLYVVLTAPAETKYLLPKAQQVSESCQNYK